MKKVNIDIYVKIEVLLFGVFGAVVSAALLSPTVPFTLSASAGFFAAILLAIVLGLNEKE